MSRRDVSKYRESSSRTSAGSRDSEIVVNPTRSAKRTDTRRRSAAGLSTGADVRTGTVASSSAAPHSPQNLSRASFGAPQEGHARARAVPHWPQNFLLGAFSNPHVGHLTP